MHSVKFNFLHLSLIIYLACIIIFHGFINMPVFNFIIKPLFWLSMVNLVYKKYNYPKRFDKLNDNLKTMVIATLFYLILNFLSGLIIGYTKNPYSLQFISFISNFYQIVLVIIFIEYTRSAVINRNANNKFMVIFFTIIFLMLEINYNTLFNDFLDREILFKYVCSTIIPLMFANILYTYLTLKGSYKLVLVYRILTETCFLIIPILTKLDWFMLGIRGIIAPTIIYLFIKFTNTNHLERKTIRRKKTKNPLIYVPLFTIIIVFVGFMIGIFKYEPIAILSNSMEPVVNRGDVVIDRKGTKEELANLEIYTIILYNKEAQTILYRIMEKYTEKG